MPNNNTRAGVFLSNEKRENNREMGETSFRVYYGATGAAIPFMWESQPGTPKHPIFDKNDYTVPPLTPPPSYLSSPSLSIGHGIGHSLSNNKRRKSRIFDIILSSLSRKNSHVTPTSSPSSTLSWSTTSSSSFSISSPSRGGRKNRRSISFCSFGAKSPLFDDEEEINSNNNEMCLGFKKKYKGCYSMQDMKNAILSIKGY